MHPAGLLFMPVFLRRTGGIYMFNSGFCAEKGAKTLRIRCTVNCNKKIDMKKGVFGYLSGKRIFSVLKSILLLAAVLAVYFAALRHFGTNRNVFSILAAVGALPTGRSIVETIMLVRARGASQAVKEGLSGIGGLDDGRCGYDLYLTSYEKAYSLSHAAAGRGRLAGYTEDPSTDPAQCARYIEGMLSKEGLTGYQASVYSDLEEYLKILREDIFPAAAGRDGAQENGSREQDKKVMQLLFAISL